jgi:hypothetical protein
MRGLFEWILGVPFKRRGSCPRAASDTSVSTRTLIGLRGLLGLDKKFVC